MIFQQKEPVLYVTAQEIYIVPSSGGATLATLHATYSWDVESLPQILEAIKKTYGTSVRVLVGDDCSYVVSTHVDTVSRESVAFAVSGQVPENLDNTIWHYSQYDDRVQVVVYSASFSETFIKPLKKAGIEIVAIEPVSVMAVSQIGPEKSGILIMKQLTTDIVAFEKGVVVQTHRVPNDSLSQHVREFMGYLQEKFGKGYSELYVWGVEASEVGVPEELGVTVIPVSLNPAEAIAAKKGHTAAVGDVSASPQVSSIKSRVIVASLVGFIALTLGGGWLAMNQFRLTEGEERRVAPTPIVRVSPTETMPPVASAEATLTRSEISVAILNGSGVAGAAGELSDGISQLGYTVSEVGNAPRADYEETHLQLHPDVPAEFQDELDKFLQDNYTEVVVEAKIASDEADITIIIGASK